MAKKSLLKTLDNPVDASLAQIMNVCINAAEEIRKLRAVNRVLRAKLDEYKFKK